MGCSVREAQAFNVAELQSIALALTHSLTESGVLDRRSFFYQEE